MAISDIPILAMLRERMQWHQARQQVLAENVANADTPNYQAKDLAPPNFERELSTASLQLAVTEPDRPGARLGLWPAGSAGLAGRVGAGPCSSGRLPGRPCSDDRRRRRATAALGHRCRRPGAATGPPLGPARLVECRRGSSASVTRTGLPL